MKFYSASANQVPLNEIKRQKPGCGIVLSIFILLTCRAFIETPTLPAYTATSSTFSMFQIHYLRMVTTFTVKTPTCGVRHVRGILITMTSSAMRISRNISREVTGTFETKVPRHGSLVAAAWCPEWYQISRIGDVSQLNQHDPFNPVESSKSCQHSKKTSLKRARWRRGIRSRNIRNRAVPTTEGPRMDGRDMSSFLSFPERVASVGYVVIIGHLKLKILMWKRNFGSFSTIVLQKKSKKNLKVAQTGITSTVHWPEGLEQEVSESVSFLSSLPLTILSWFLKKKNENTKRNDFDNFVGFDEILLKKCMVTLYLRSMN